MRAPDPQREQEHSRHVGRAPEAQFVRWSKTDLSFVSPFTISPPTSNIGHLSTFRCQSKSLSMQKEMLWAP